MFDRAKSLQYLYEAIPLTRYRLVWVSDLESESGLYVTVTFRARVEGSVTVLRRRKSM